MRVLLIPVLALAVSGCASGVQVDPDRSAAIRAVFAQQVAAWNAAGVDPVRMDPQKQLYAALACGTLTSLSTLIDPTVATLPTDAGDWCLTLTQALAPAVAPAVAPAE